MSSNAYNLKGFVMIMENWGLSDVLLPFLLIFVIVFAIITKTKVFGEKNRKLNGAFALVMAIITVVVHLNGTFPAKLDPVLLINSAIPSITGFIVALICVIMFVGLFGGETQSKQPMHATTAVIILCAVIYVLFARPDLSPLMFVIVLLLLGMITFFSGGTKPEYTKGGVTVIAFIAVFVAFGIPMGWFDQMPVWFNNSGFYGWIAMIFIGMATIGLVIGGEKE